MSSLGIVGKPIFMPLVHHHIGTWTKRNFQGTRLENEIFMSFTPTLIQRYIPQQQDIFW